ncbi:uncharacterized protein [Drosophila tropicalis]|uniref:uncharacterized protein n=1 Tax=Drosophila tropicalis TaxID=46794 RepID=UPI0035ABD4F1
MSQVEVPSSDGGGGGDAPDDMSEEQEGSLEEDSPPKSKPSKLLKNSAKPSYSVVRSKGNYCCIVKEYFSEYTNLVDSLLILPRLIVHKTGFQKNLTYGLTLTIRNMGLYPRLIQLSSDSPIDTSISIVEADLHRYLETDESLDVKIWIRSSTTVDINRRRHIFIQSFHPDIIFQVPIIVLDGDNTPSICEAITFPSSVPSNNTHFEMIVYNPTKDRMRMRCRNTNRGLSINTLNKDMLAPRDYIKILLTLHPRKLQVYKGFFNVKFGVSPPHLVVFDYTPRSMGVYLSAGYVKFGLARFGSEHLRSIRVCNDSPHDVFMDGDFQYDRRQTDTSRSSASSRSRLSNKLIEDAISMHSVLMYDFEENANAQNVTYDAKAGKHFCVSAPKTLEGWASDQIIIALRPVYSESEPFPDELEPPYHQRTKLMFCFSDVEECIESHFVIVTGDVAGVVVEVHPSVIDFRKIYLGEEHCAHIKFLNVDDVQAKVTFKDYQDPQIGGVRISPVEGFQLEPCTRGIFHLSFFSTIPARFTLTLRFKVENGTYHKVLVKGAGQHVQLRTFPQLVEFGSIPMAVPQKRYMLLMNPLAVPITLQVHATEDGEEQPLVLNIRDSSEMLPITVRDPISHLQRVHEDLRNNDSLLNEDIELSNLEPDMLSVHSYNQNESVYSVEFEEDVMEPVPVMAAHLLTNLKKQKIFDKSETDKRVIQEALQSLLNTKYFSVFTKHNNFIFMDWNAIPSDPQEVYCDNEIIYLRPNTGRSITILIIPNKVGYFHRSLTVRICPALPSNSPDSSEDHLNDRILIKSDFLCSKLWFEYNCCVPEIEWDNLVDLTRRVIYAGESYDFDMKFLNLSNVGGFLHFDVIPNDMSFRDGTWKFYISSGCQIEAKCSVTFRSLGTTKLSGLVKIVGAPRPYPFHLLANVLPTEIRINPNYVHGRLQVYELSKIHFYIDNYSPTNTKLSMKLKDTEFQYLTTMGGILAASGQSMYTTLVSCFPDPDLYQNVLYIDLKFDHIMELPITFLVEGVPLYFYPNIRKGFNTGLLYTDTKESFHNNIYSHRFPVKVINRGLRAYRVQITRLKVYGTNLARGGACSIQPLTARLDIMPKHIMMPSGGEEHLEIMASSYSPGTFFCDFLLEVTDLKYPQRKFVIKINTQATFIESQLSWQPKQLLVICHPLKERTHIEIPKLANHLNLEIDQVVLQAAGPLRIKELFEHTFEKEISVKIKALEHKEIFVTLNKGALKHLQCKQIEGRINVIARGKPQKPLIVKVSVQVPEVLILQPELVLFDRGHPYNVSVDLVNQGCLVADFKWKRLETHEQFVGDVDDPQGIVADFLAEILRMLEYNFTCDDEPNMTLRYQQCRCQFVRETESGNLVLNIIDEVINDLDLSHKRFVIPGLENIPPSVDNSDICDSKCFVQRTIYDIMDRLNIESSQELSPVSSEYCFAESYIYFHEKSGQVNVAEDQSCLLHIPHIRRSHEVKARFELSILGGQSRYLTVTLVNLQQLLKFHKETLYLGIKPWYESYHATVRISNVTNYPLSLIVGEINPTPRNKQLIAGYAKLESCETFESKPLAEDRIKVNGIFGFNENFLRTFGVVINTSAYCYFWLKGQGILPILSMSSDLPRVQQDISEIIDEYHFMQRIYYYETFKSITETDKEPLLLAGEEDGNPHGLESDGISDDFSLYPTTDDEEQGDEQATSDRQRLRDYQMFRLVQSYVLVNNNQELPHPVVLKQMLLAERYIHRLHHRPEVYALHQQVYQSYVKQDKSSSKAKSVNVKHFTVQPIPCEQHGYILDLGLVPLNTLRRFEIRLHFYGPGKLKASARTAVRIPGLYVDFQVGNHADKKFSFWAEKCTALEYFKNKYRNMVERVTTNPEDSFRLKHAHSFDLDRSTRHQRDLHSKDRHIIDEYYNSLNLSVYPDHKHHFTLAKVFSASPTNFSGVDIHLVGFFKPESKFYERNQLLQDYIYIDLHLGPTLPILLTGRLI